MHEGDWHSGSGTVWCDASCANLDANLRLSWEQQGGDNVTLGFADTMEHIDEVSDIQTVSSHSVSGRERISSLQSRTGASNGGQSAHDFSARDLLSGTIISCIRKALRGKECLTKTHHLMISCSF